MTSYVQGVTDGGAIPRALAPGEAPPGPPASAGSTQAPTPVATTNDGSTASASTISRVERVRPVLHELRRSKPPEADHPVWKYFSVYVKEAYKCFALCLLCDRSGRHEALIDDLNMWRNGKSMQTYQKGKRH